MINSIIKKVIGTGGSSLSILIYHQVFEQWDYLHPDEPTISQFERQMRVIREHFVPLSLSRAMELLQENRLPTNAACITFDDGYLDNLTHAVPILQRMGIPATIFVATDFIGDGIMWNDRILEAVRSSKNDSWDLRNASLGVLDMSSPNSRHLAAKHLIKKIKHLPTKERTQVVEIVEEFAVPCNKQLMMSRKQLQQLDEFNIEVGAHTMSHPILNTLQQTDAKKEIVGSKQILEELLQKPVDFFAYPNGRYTEDFDNTHVDIVRSSGFTGAVATNWGAASSTTDMFRLPRFTPWDKHPSKFLYRLLKNTHNAQ
ncbi:polysaccharide deacetylase family protein [Pseudomaricurvus alkylphenolicus]|uniref:polysaccharide deacetylase family protein n=1 Tax=Pseudomaricurvus alkylphenolicus TaxID=1306991 RepID=UPI00141EE093|nr:polysaccharide deacetylase family protein [Pseudomaricurvus alkylphenolicus]NIB43127.1 polysaccharide deacetylase family protein [Pseudomaricurvus alkylphenolicus]